MSSVAFSPFWRDCFQLSVLPLILVLDMFFSKRVEISLTLLTELPPPPGLDGGGIGNALIGTFVVTAVAALVAIPIGVGVGIY